MAKKQTPRTEGNASEGPGRIRQAAWMALITVAVVCIGFAGLYLVSQIENFIIRDPRFAIPASKDYGEESPNIRIEGVKNASPERLRDVFAKDIGRSLYLFPVAERRRNLLAVDWVKDATVLRLWPNSVLVKVQERTPVAFIPASSTGGLHRSALIDEEGEILYPHRKAEFRLPVLIGVTPNQPLEVRRSRVRRVMRLMNEVGPLMEKISEIDASNPDSLRVTMQVRDRAVVLILGKERFLSRLNNFLNHYEEIRQRLPEATVLDLRLDDRITATE